MKTKVVIIGAGPAGITAAYQLLKDKEKYEIVILESDNAIGGISKTVEMNKYLVDTGIHRFFTKDIRVEKLWKELLPLQGKYSYDDKLLGVKKELAEGGPDPDKDDKVMLLKDRITRIYYGRKFYDYPISMKKETFLNLGFVNVIKAGFSYLKVCFIKKKETSLENFFINRFGKYLYSVFFENYTEKVWGRHPSQISADWGAQRVKGISIVVIIKDMFATLFGKKNKTGETSLIDQFWYPKLGAGQMWDVMAEEIKKNGGKLLKNHEVVNINIKEKKILSVECKVGEELEVISGDVFISSMPIKDLVTGMNGEDVPDRIIDIAEKLPYREFMSVCLVVDSLKLKNNTKTKTIGDIVPDSWIYIQEPEVKLGRLQIFNNWSPYLFPKPQDMENCVLIGLEYFCSYTDEYWNMPDKDFIDFAIEEAAKIGIIENKEVVRDSKRIKINKAYPAYFDSYEYISEVIEYLNIFGNLYCVGRNGQHRYNNMDHSIITGMEAANNIKNDIKTKENVWEVNTEQTYHEQKEEEGKK